MITADFHTHSSFSFDVEKTKYFSPENIVRTASQRGLTAIAITDHQDWDVYYSNELFETGEYLRTLMTLKEEVRNQIFLGVGVEIGLMPHLTEGYRKYTKEHPFDIVIGSIHAINGVDPYDGEYFDEKTYDEGYEEAFQYTLECLKDEPDFDVLGHLDYVVRYGDKNNGPELYSRFPDIIDSVLRELIRQGKGIEINTSGLRSGMPSPNPSHAVLARYRELGGEIVTVGSDAHDPSDLAYCFDLAEAVLKDCGFSYYCIFSERCPTFQKL